jgi:hypothetical protein
LTDSAAHSSELAKIATSDASRGGARAVEKNPKAVRAVDVASDAVKIFCKR